MAAVEDHQLPALKPGPSRAHPNDSYRDASRYHELGSWEVLIKRQVEKDKCLCVSLSVDSSITICASLVRTCASSGEKNSVLLDLLPTAVSF